MNISGIRQNDKCRLIVGPFFDYKNGRTLVDLKNINCSVVVYKNGAPHESLRVLSLADSERHGWYYLQLFEHDTDTIGRLDIHIDTEQSFPVYLRAYVFPPQAFDQLSQKHRRGWAHKLLAIFKRGIR